MSVYSSVTLGEINEHPHPLAADGNGRWPNVFFDDATFQFYRVRVTDAGGALIYDDDSVPIIGQSAGEGGPPPVPIDQNALARTGDVKLKFAAANDPADAGWVRCNGGTIGKAGSGASELADASCQDLFVHLWSSANNTICPLAGGAVRTTALNDFNTGQQITLPDMRGRAPFGINAMGNTLTDRIDPAYVDTATPGKENVVGAVGGDDAIVLAANDLPAHQHPGAGGTTGTPPVAAPLVAAAHTHKLVANDTVTAPANLTAANRIANFGFHNGDKDYDLLGTTEAAELGLSAPSAPAAVTGNTGNNVTTGLGHENMPPFMLFVFQIKL